MFSGKFGKYLVPLTVALGSLMGGTASAANPASTTTTTGQQLNILITSPTDGSTVPAGPLTVTGVTSIGPINLNTAVLYVVDNSGSTGGTQGFPFNQDCNGDGVVNTGDNFDADPTIGTTLDCELSGIKALNESLTGVTGITAGLIAFDGDAEILDVDPVAPGLQGSTTPAADVDANGERDIPQAGRILVPGVGTNYNAALTLMNAAFATRPPTEAKVAFFLSDGFPSRTPPDTFTTGPGSPLAAAAAAGTRINTYSVGAIGTGCAPGVPLRVISDATGGTCTEVLDPSDLVTMLPGSTPTGIDFVQVSVDGGPAVTATLDALGNFSANTSIAGAGPHMIFAQVFANDGTTTFATVTVNVASLVVPILVAQPVVATVLSPPGTLLRLHLRFEARLSVGGVGVPGKPIVFALGNQSCVGITNVNGTATCSLTLGRLLQSVIRLGYNAFFLGDAGLAPAAARGSLLTLLGIRLF